MSEKLDALDLVINTLREHEKTLSHSIDELKRLVNWKRKLDEIEAILNDFFKSEAYMSPILEGMNLYRVLRRIKEIVKGDL